MSGTPPPLRDDTDPHGRQKIFTAGPLPDKAAGTLILLHGRGASAHDMLGLYDELDLPTFAAIAPQAAQRTWYPRSFLAPLEANQPDLNSALHKIDSIISDLFHQGILSERIALLGFSQGACLTLEYVAQHPRQYGAVIGLTGGLIGPPETPRNYLGSLAKVPVFLGTSDPDAHVPVERVEETRDVLSRMGASVDFRRYRGMPHTINKDEIDTCRKILQQVIAS